MDATNSSLYHYTSGDGLIGILRNKSLWATDINFLNDHREFELGSKLIGDLSKVKVQELIKKNFADSLEVREKLLGDLESFTTSLHSLTSGFNHNTISFTSKFDCLRHWISYCNQTTGYCIEFDRKLLSKSLCEIDLPITEFVEIEYAQIDQMNFKIEQEVKEGARIYFERVLHSLSNKTESEEESHLEFITKLIQRRIIKSASLKSQEWEDEAETRFICSTDDAKQLEYRSKNGVIIPYIQCAIDSEAIRSITIGPASNPELAHRGLQFLSESAGMDFEIQHSNCSLRDF